MRTLRRVVSIASLLFGGVAFAMGGETQENGQLVLVLVKNPNDFRARIATFERDANHQWRSVLPMETATIGKKGIAWGLGEHDLAALGLPEFNHTDPATPYRVQGGLKSPAGIFRLGIGFGKHSAETVSAQAGVPLKWPYFKIDEQSHCAGDAEDFPTYNVIYPDMRQSPRTYRVEEGEQLIDYVTGNSMQYEYSVEMLHNSDQSLRTPKKAYAGACIFLHVWSNNGNSGTAGCTGMRRESMRQVLTWLVPEKNPVIVQLTDENYRKLKDEWGLPGVNLD